MTTVVVFSGRTFTGKSILARELKNKFNIPIVKTSDLISERNSRTGAKSDRFSLQKLGDQLDRKTSSQWLIEDVRSIISRSNINIVAVDNVRTWKQLELFRAEYDWRVVHVHLYAPNEVREERLRYAKHFSGNTSKESLEEIDLIKSSSDIDMFRRDADVRIWTGRDNVEHNVVRIAARLGLYAPPNFRCVDVLVGGQYGSEGKGHIVGYLAREYDVLVRVGGPNAGHTVSSKSGIYTYHHLPSGCRDTTADVLLGPGMTLDPQKLLKEVNECGISENRLFIDPQAMVIETSDKEFEARFLVGSISSTGQGGGSASARRILERHSEDIRLARDVPELQKYVKPTVDRLEQAYFKRQSILLEGTQGSALSIFHGTYPHVTSRDTNVAGCLAEVGISPSRVRRILMVLRYTPIRVGGPSGPLPHETNFDEVAKAANLRADELKKAEKTSTTGRDRRVGWFDWEVFRRSCNLNAPTDLVLTFTDYIDSKNRNARRFEQLTEDTIKFIEELEQVAHAPVSLINTRFPNKDQGLDIRSIIDRRTWNSARLGLD